MLVLLLLDPAFSDFRGGKDIMGMEKFQMQNLYYMRFGKGEIYIKLPKMGCVLPSSSLRKVANDSSKANLIGIFYSNDLNLHVLRYVSVFSYLHFGS